MMSHSLKSKDMVQQLTGRQKSFAYRMQSSCCLWLRTRSTPEGKSTSPPLSANLPTNRSLTAHTFVIPKGSGLGIVISGGINRQDGPHIFIEKILDGMDAAKVRRAQQCCIGVMVDDMIIVIAYTN